MATYAAGADLLERKRADTVNDLVGDDGVRLSREDLLTDTTLVTALSDASGAIDGALLAGGRYSTGDLEGLTGNSLSLLKRTCCDIAMAFLLDRNPQVNVDEGERYQELANRYLERLRTGENIFNLAEAARAGMPTIDGPTAIDYDRLQLLPERTRRFYPNRVSRLPTDRG